MENINDFLEPIVNITFINRESPEMKYVFIEKHRAEFMGLGSSGTKKTVKRF